MATQLKAADPLPEYRDILEVLKKDQFLPGVSVERQLTAHLRDLIHRKKLVSHTRIPPFRLLASVWKTNYRTVQLAVTKLATEGLVIRSPMKGTFVAPTRRPLKRVCLYLNSSRLGGEAFYTHLNMMLFSELSRQGVATTTFFDHRPKKQLNDAPPEVLDMVRQGDIDALIGGVIQPKNTEWLLKLGIPTASIMFQSENRLIETDYAEFARLSIGEACAIGASSVGLIYPTPGPDDATAHRFLFEMEKQAAEKGVHLIMPTLSSVSQATSWEQKGNQLGEKLLTLGPLPVALIVYPDSLVSGVAHAILQHQIQVPKDVSVICHRNFETPINLPFPVTWLTVKIKDFAQALIRQIRYQIAGKELKATKISFSVERPSIP